MIEGSSTDLVKVTGRSMQNKVEINTSMKIKQKIKLIYITTPNARHEIRCVSDLFWLLSRVT